MANLAYLNGRLIPAHDLTLSFADAGFVFGATVSDFCRTYRHRLFRWPDHLARFRHDCDAVGISLPYSDAELTTAADALVADRVAQLVPSDDLALITFATPGVIGYLAGGIDPEPSPAATVGMHTIPLNRDRYRRFFAEGVTLAIAGVWTADPTGIVPARVKHRSRLHWWLAARAAGLPSGAVPVLLNAAGYAADTAIGTVLAVRDGMVLRPPRDTVLDGISARVVEEFCGKLGVRFAEANLDFRQLPNDVTEVMLAGSAFGIAGVRVLYGPCGSRSFDWPGPLFGKILAKWNELVGLDLADQMLADSGPPVVQTSNRS